MFLSAAEVHARQALLKRGIWPMIEQGESLESLLTRLTENIEAQAGAGMLAAIFLYNPSKNDLTIGAAPNLQPIYKKAVNGFKCGPEQPACGSAIFKRQQVICVDVRTDPLWINLRTFAEAIGVRAVWSQPILADDGRALGTIAFYHPEPKAPGEPDRIILETSATIASEIIQSRKAQAILLVNSDAPAEEHRHQCMIYDGAPSRHLTLLASLARKKIEEGYRCLYLNSPTMVAGFRSTLSAMGVDVAKEVEHRRLILSSDSPVAADGNFDIEEMLRGLEEELRKSLDAGFKGLFATGDMTWEFGAEKNFSKLLEYEYRLEAIFQRNGTLRGICQYHRSSLPPDALRHGLVSHKYIFVNETLSHANLHYLPSGRIEDRQASDAELDEAIDTLCQMQK